MELVPIELVPVELVPIALFNRVIHMGALMGALVHVMALTLKPGVRNDIVN